MNSVPKERLDVFSFELGSRDVVPADIQSVQIHVVVDSLEDSHCEVARDVVAGQLQILNCEVVRKALFHKLVKVELLKFEVCEREVSQVWESACQKQLGQGIEAGLRDFLTCFYVVHVEIANNAELDEDTLHCEPFEEFA